MCIYIKKSCFLAFPWVQLKWCISIIFFFLYTFRSAPLNVPSLHKTLTRPHGSLLPPLPELCQLQPEHHIRHVIWYVAFFIFSCLGFYVQHSDGGCGHTMGAVTPRWWHHQQWRHDSGTTNSNMIVAPPTATRRQHHQW